MEGDPPEENAQPPPTMDIQVRSLVATAIVFRVLRTAKVRDLKRRIREENPSSIPISRQEIVYNKKALDDNKLLTDYGISDGSTVQIVPKIRTGTRDIKPEEDYSEEGIFFRPAGGGSALPGSPFVFIFQQDGGLGQMIPDSGPMVRRSASDSELSSRTKKKREADNNATKSKMMKIREMMEKNKQKRKQKNAIPSCLDPVPLILRPGGNRSAPNLDRQLDTLEELSTDQVEWTESETDNYSQTDLTEEYRTPTFLTINIQNGLKKKCALCEEYRPSTRFYICRCQRKFCYKHKNPRDHNCPVLKNSGKSEELDFTQDE